MALILGTNCGFVSVAPTSDPGGTANRIQNFTRDMNDTTPSTAAKITEVGWWCDNATEAADYEIGLYDNDGAVVPGEAGTRLAVSTGNAKGTTSGWKSVAVNWPVTGGKEYWLAIALATTATQTDIDVQALAGTDQDFKANVGTLTDPFNGGVIGISDYCVALYAVWETAGTSTQIKGKYIEENAINDTHIDWGTGSDQVSQDNVVDGSTYVRTHNDLTDTLAGNIATNNAKETNVSTNLSEGTSTETTVDVNSSDGDNATLVSASTSRAGLLTKEKFDEIVANTAKETNTVTNITVVEAPTNVEIQSSDGTNDTIAAADETNAGVMTTTMYDEHVANNAKETNTVTNITVVEAPTNVEIQSSDGTNDTIAAADETNAGVMTTTMYDEHVANNAKETNVSTNLSEGTSTETTVDVNSSDGDNATLVSASTSRAGLLTKEKFDEIVANTAKETNTVTNITVVEAPTNVEIQSSDGTNDTIAAADETNAGVMTTTMYDEHVANNAKETNTVTNITVVEAPTNVEIQSSDGTNDTIAAADGTNAGVMTTTMYDEHVANNAKETNVSTNLSEGTSTETTVDVNSSDGDNATLVSASTSRAGLLTKAKFDEIVANTSASHTQGTDTSLGSMTANIDMNTHKLTGLAVPSANGDSIRATAKITEAKLEACDDHVNDNTQAHSDYLLNSGADVAVGPITITADNSTADQSYVPMVLYNTDETPPAASGFPVGTIYIQYTA